MPMSVTLAAGEIHCIVCSRASPFLGPYNSRTGLLQPENQIHIIELPL